MLDEIVLVSLGKALIGLEDFEQCLPGGLQIFAGDNTTPWPGMNVPSRV